MSRYSDHTNKEKMRKKMVNIYTYFQRAQHLSNKFKKLENARFQEFLTEVVL